MKFAADTVQTQIPQIMDLDFSTINSLYEISGLSTPVTRIRTPIDVSHWSAPDHVFGEEAAVGTSEEKSDHDYNYKNEFQIWKDNKEFEPQFFSMIRPPLYSTPVGTKTTNTKISHLDSTTVGTKTPDTKPLTIPTESSKHQEKTQK